MQLKTAVVALMTAQGMAISQAFEVHLDHLEQADIAGHELLDGMVESLGRGENPSPAESQPRALTAEEVAFEANMIAAHAKAEEEANRLARQVAAAKADADARRAQEVATAARLKAFQDAEASIFNNQPPGGQDQQVADRVVGGAPLQPLVQAILAGVGRNT